MPVERSDVEQDQPERRHANMVAQRGGQLATQGAPPLTFDSMSIPPGQQVSPVANSPPMSSSSRGSSAQDVQGGDADDIGVRGTHPAARKRTQHSARVAPSTPTAGGQFRTHHHLQEGGDPNYDDSHRRPQAGVPFAAAADGEKDGYGQGFGLLGDMCALADLLSAGLRYALSDEEGLLDPIAAAQRWLAEPLSDGAVEAVLETLLCADPDGNIDYKERFAVVTDFDNLIYVVGETYGLYPLAQQPAFFRDAELPPHEPYGFHYMILLLLRTGNIVTNMEATLDLAGYDCLNITASDSFQDRSPTSMLAALMTNVRVFHRDMLVRQDGEEATGAALAESHVTGDVTRTAQLRAQLAMIGELETAIAVVMGADEITLTARQRDDMIGSEAAVVAAQQRSATQASVQGFESWRRGRAEVLRRDHPTFLEQQQVLHSRRSPGDPSLLSQPHGLSSTLQTATTTASAPMADQLLVRGHEQPHEHQQPHRHLTRHPYHEQESRHMNVADQRGQQRTSAGGPSQGPPVPYMQRYVDPGQQSSGYNRTYQDPHATQYQYRPATAARVTRSPTFSNGRDISGRHGLASGYLGDYHEDHGFEHAAGHITEYHEANGIDKHGFDVELPDDFDFSNTVSVDFKIPPALLEKMLRFDGTHEPVTLKQWAASIKSVAFQIPKADQSPVLFSYLCWLSIDGVAKDTVVSMNRVCVAEGKLEYHMRPDKGKSISTLLYQTYPREETNLYALHMMQVMRTYWRDPRGGSKESLKEYRHRLFHHASVAMSHYKMAVPFFSALQMWLVFVIGCPREIQSWITSQTHLGQWDRADLNNDQISELHKGANTEYEQRLKRGDKLTVQKQMAAYPLITAVDGRVESTTTTDAAAAEILDAAYVSHDGSAGAGGRGGGGRGKKTGKPSADVVQRRAASKALCETLMQLNEAQQWEKLREMKTAGDKAALMGLMLSLKHEGNADTRSVASLKKMPQQKQSMFHALMALMYEDGHLLVKGATGRQKSGARFKNTFLQPLISDDDGKDLYKIDAESMKKLAAMDNSALSGAAAVDLMKSHYLKVDGQQQPACFICAEVGHQGCACMKFLQCCKDGGIISSIPAVASTKYTYGHPAEVCTGDLIELDTAAVKRLVFDSVASAEDEVMAMDCDDVSRTAGVTIHRGDDDWPLGLLPLLRRTARLYLPDEVDKVFNVQPQWRLNGHGVLLPHQVEDAYEGFRSIGRDEASPAITEQVMNMLKDKVPKHNGRSLSCYRDRALKPLFRYPDCPAQPSHRDGRHGLAVIMPLTKDYVIYIYPWRSESDYEEAGASMLAQVEHEATDRVYGPPVKVVVNPGDVIIFDKRLGHFGGPARTPEEIQQSGDDTTWLSDDPDRPVTDAAWHIHLDDHEQAESLLDDGEDPVYYVYPSVPSDDGMTLDELKAATLEEIAFKGYPIPKGGPAWSYEDFPDLHGMAPTAAKHAELLASELSPVPRQVIIMYFGPSGRPLRCLVDSGASRTFMLEQVGVEMAQHSPSIHIRRPVRDLKLRLADGQISGDTIDKEIKDVQYSQLNGRVKGTHDVMLLPSMPPGIEVILARDFIFNSLNAIITADSLICYAMRPPDVSGFGKRIPEADESKWQPLNFETPAGFDVATMWAEHALDGQAIAVTDCGPIDEIAFADGSDFDELAKAALTDFVQAALVVKPKKRSKSQRDAVALLKSLDQLPGLGAAFGPDLHTGPRPIHTGGDSMVAATLGPRPLPRHNKVFPAIAKAVASLLLLLSCGGENGAVVDAAELSSISVEAPLQWTWPLDTDDGEFEVPWIPVDNLEQPVPVGPLWGDVDAVYNAGDWYTDIGFVAVDSTSTDEGAEMAAASGAAAKQPLPETTTEAPPITREKWYPLLRYEMLTHPAGATTLKARLAAAGHDGVPAAKVQLAMDVIQPETVDAGIAHEPPPEGNRPRKAGRIPDGDVDTPWPHCRNIAAANCGNTERFTCLDPMEKFDPPAHHKRLKFELKNAGASLPRFNPRPTPLGMVDLACKFVKGLEVQGRINKSTSPVGSPMLIIPKPKKDPLDPPRYRCVIDFRRINEFIKPHSFRLPTCDSLWYTLDDAKYISTADAADGYWLAPLDQETKWLTAFDTPMGRYEWNCLPMGIQPAAGWFQCFMEDALARHNLLYTTEANRKRNANTGLMENFVIVYQDDLIWWSDTVAEHQQMTELLLDAFSTEKLHLNPNKLNLFCKHTRYLGCIVGNSTLSMDPRKVDAIYDMAMPTDTTAVRQLVGMAQFYRRWIPAFSSITSPLTDMLKKGIDFATAWGKPQEEAVQTLKAKMTEYPTLRQFDPTKPCIALVDASKTGLGGCLAQQHDGELFPVSYSSHRLTAAERNYPITELEGLAILHFIRCHRHFLVRNPFTLRVLSDHQPLQWVQKVSTASGRLARWLMELADYDFRIEFIPGKVNDVADALSRLHAATPADASSSIEFRDYLREQEVMCADTELLFADYVFATEWDDTSAAIEKLGEEDSHITDALPHEWRGFVDPTGVDTYLAQVVSQHSLQLSQRCNAAAYLACGQFADIYSGMQAKAAGDGKTAAAQDEVAGEATESTERTAEAAAGTKPSGSKVPSRMMAGMYVINESLFTAGGRLCVPEALRTELMTEVHQNDAVGHRGATSMHQQLVKRLYWPGMERDVRTHVAKCADCASSKSTTQKHWGKLRPHLPPTGPFTHYSIDFMFGFPKAGGGPMQYDGIMNVVDMFSKRLIPIPVWEASKAEVMAEQFYRSVVCNRGVMMSMVSDRDSRFTNDFWRKLWALHHTTLKMTPAYTPQADGQTERMNRLLQEIMRSNVQADQLNWLELLDGAMMAINNSPVSATQKSPFEMETGLAMRIPLDTQTLMDQTRQNRGHGQLVRDTMKYDDDGTLLDKAPFPGVYEMDQQEAYQLDHPERMRAIHQLAREQMIQAKTRMAEAENQNRPIREWQTGEFVMLSLEHIQLPVWAVSKCRKLRGKYFGPFPIVQVHTQLAIELQLPTWLHQAIHPVFHPMYLKPSSTIVTDKKLKQKIGSVFEPAEYGVEGILAHRKRHGKTEYLVQWENCSYLQSTWEPEAGLVSAQRILTAYNRKSRKIEMELATAMVEDGTRLGHAINRERLCA